MSQPLAVTRFPLRGSRLIEASAGTGKTYTIALLYVRLVLGHGDGDEAFTRPLVPPEILVVTFTDAASQELVDRIRARLTEAARVFAGQHTVATGDALQDIVNAYPASEHAACAMKLQRAAEWMDEAAVSTIHSWCYRMLCEHAFDSLHLFTQELVTNQDDLLQEVVDDYWRQQFYGLPTMAAEVVRDRLKSPVELTESLKSLLSVGDVTALYGGEPMAQADDPTALSAWIHGRHAAVERIRTLWQTHQAELEALLRARWDDLDGRTHGKAEAVLPVIAQWAQSQEMALPTKLEKLSPDNVKFKAKAKNSEPLSHPVFDAIQQRLTDFCDSDLDRRLAELKYGAARWVRKELEQRLIRRAELGFDDILQRLHAALQGDNASRLAAAIRAQFPVALIDEFQDTDPVQYGIFNAVYSIEHNDADTALVMIGDPKQAIYAFRGADIHTYIDARRATTGRHYTLGKNFRSTAALVASVNQFFLHAEAHARGAFRFKTETDNPVPFESVASQGRNDRLQIAGDEPPPITMWYLPGQNQYGVTGPGVYQEAMAQAAASEIVRWLQLAQAGQAGFVRHGEDALQPLRPSDMAILVRTGTEARVMRAALSERGVHSVYLSDRDSVFASIEAGDVLRCLRAVAEPGDERLLKAALACGTLQLPLHTLAPLLEDEVAWEMNVMRFRAYRTQWQKQGVLPMLRQLLMDYGIATGLLARANGERTLTNLLHIAEWLQQQSVQVDGEQALVRLLADRINHPTEEDVIRLESDADLVKVVTVHKSKGLEYPLVLLPFVCSTRQLDGRKAATVTYHTATEAGVWKKYLELIGKPASAESAYAQANAERIDEDMRLLYVALTRAQHAVWLGVTPLGASKSSQDTVLSAGAMGYWLNGGEAVPADALPATLSAVSVQCGVQWSTLPDITDTPYEAAVVHPVLDGARVLARPAAAEPWWVASYSALKTGATTVASSDDDALPSDFLPMEPEDARQSTAEEEREAEGTVTSQAVVGREKTPSTLHQFPRGPNPGTFLHGLLEWAALQGFAVAAQDDALRRDYIARCCHQRKWDHWIDLLDAWMKALLTTPLPVGEQSITLANVSRCLPEMEFWFESRYVNTLALDRQVRQHTLRAAERPQLLNNLLNGLLKGFIDLVFEYNGKYFVADWKSNWLGDAATAYTRDAMCDAVLHKRYELQYTLYILALHRHLQDRLQTAYDYDQHIGGAVYVFLRGIENTETRGVHFEKPPKQLIEALDGLFAKQQEECEQ